MPWDDYFMSIAFLASMRGPCTRLRVGSVVVKDHRIIAMGYIAGAPHIMRDNHEQAIIHSEINAVSRRGASLQDATIYVNAFTTTPTTIMTRLYQFWPKTPASSSLRGMRSMRATRRMVSRYLSMVRSNLIQLKNFNLGHCIIRIMVLGLGLI